MPKNKTSMSKSYTKGATASVPRKKVRLKQTRLTDLSTSKAFREGSSETVRVPEASSMTASERAIVDQPVSADQAGTFDAVMDSAPRPSKAREAMEASSSDGSDSDGYPAAQRSRVSNSITTTTTATNPRKSRKHYHQSKIQFIPGGSRYISTDPMDSEEEEFRATQMVPNGAPQDKSIQIDEQIGASVQTLEVDSGSGSDARVTSPFSKVSTRTPLRGTSRRITSDDSDEEELITPLKRRKRFMPDAPAHGDCSESPERQKHRNQDQELVEEARDLKFNQMTTIEDNRRRNTKKSTFRSNLERLRRKKAGVASDNDDAVEEEPEESPSDSLGEEPGNWIVDDELDREELLDAMPQEFLQPRQPLEQFKIAVQWEILDLLMPQGGLAPDHYFKPAVDWLRDRTAGKSQAAISSIWRRSFVRALQRGPELNAIQTGNLGYYCDACGRTNRVATYIVRFEGTRYDHLTLEDLDTDADLSEDDLIVDEDAASDSEEESARKERILRADWNLGINCYERTCVAHELFHLRKQLREELHDKLRDMGLFSAAKIYERSTLLTGQRIELANRITEQLESARFQQRLWARYKASIERNESYIVDPTAGRRKVRYGT